MDLVNRSGLAVAWTTFKIRPPKWALTVVVKGTFDLADPIVLAKTQIPCTGNEENYEYDFAPMKTKVDVLLVRGSGLAIERWAKSAANLGPVPMMAPERRAKLGTYDTLWHKTRWPWFPDDFDWNFFNCAPADQQLPELRGDETIAVEGLRTRLPGLWPRAFVNEGELREVPLRIDTLWIDAEAKRLILVWRGQREVSSQKLKDQRHLLVAPGDGDFRAMLEEALEARKPKKVAAPVPEPEPEPPAPPPPEPVEQPDFSALKAEADRLEAEARRKFTPTPIDPAVVEAQVNENLKRAREFLQKQGKPIPKGLDEPFRMPNFEEPGPPEPEPELPPEPAPLTRDQVLARGGKLAGEDLTGLDLSGANLSGADLSRAVLARANLAGSDLRKANLVKALLPDAKLAGADLSEADLTGAVLSDSNAEGAKFRGAIAAQASFVGSNLASSDFDKATLAKASFREAKLAGANLAGAKAAEADLQRASAKGLRATGADFTKLKAAGGDFEGADLRGILADGSVWESANLAKADLTKARLAGTEFSNANLTAANLTRANARKARFVEAILRGAQLVRLNLFQGSFEKADLTGADLREANLYEAETWEANLEGVNLRGANLRMSKLEER